MLGLNLQLQLSFRPQTFEDDSKPAVTRFVHKRATKDWFSTNFRRFCFFKTLKVKFYSFICISFPAHVNGTSSHTETTSVQLNHSGRGLFSVLTDSLDWICHSLSRWCQGSFKVTTMTMVGFRYWLAVCFRVHSPFLKIPLQVGKSKKIIIIIMRQKVQWDICCSGYQLLRLERDGGFEFPQIPLLPARDGRALRENCIPTWGFVISAADMNLPEAFKTALASRQKWEFQPQARFICQFMLLIFCSAAFHRQEAHVWALSVDVRMFYCKTALKPSHRRWFYSRFATFFWKNGAFSQISAASVCGGPANYQPFDNKPILLSDFCVSNLTLSNRASACAVKLISTVI